MKKTNLPLQSTDEKLKAYFPNVYTVRIALIFYQESLFENQPDLYRFEWMNLSDAVFSGGAGGARAPPEFRGSQKGHKSDFCLSE